MKLVRLGDLTRIKTGKLDANASSPNGKYPFFTCSREPLRIETYSYDCECVLVAGNGDLNVKYYNGKFDAYQRTYIIESNNTDVLLPRYLFFFLELYIETLREQSVGGVIKYIKLGNLTEARIPLCSVQEQAEIISLLEKQCNLIESRKNQLALFDDLVKSQFIEMFGGSEYPEQTLSECCTFIDYRGKTPEKASSGIRLITAKNVRMHYLKDEPAEYVPARNYDAIMTRGIPPLGSILFTTEAPLGNVCRIPNYQEKFCIGQRLLNIIPRKELNSLYLEYQLGSEAFQNEMRKKSSGSTVTGIRAKELIKLKIPVPPLELQNEFARFVEQTDKSKDIEELEVAA